MDGLMIVISGLGGALLAVTTYAAVVGGLGAVFGGRFERCPQCGHHGIAYRGPVHPGGCPAHRHPAQILHQWRAGLEGLHLRHHL